MLLIILNFRLAEVVEAEAENYMKVAPDPFDERHPSRADPNCTFGQMLKILFRKDTFMNKVFLFCISTASCLRGRFLIDF